MRYRELSADVVVVGAGIAGLRAALAASGRGVSVLLVSKGVAASPAVIGFNAPVGVGDSGEVFFRDTCVGGGGLNDCALAGLLTGQAVGVLSEFESLGFSFDRESAAYDLLRLWAAVASLGGISPITRVGEYGMMREELVRRRSKKCWGNGVGLVARSASYLRAFGGGSARDRIW